MESLNTLKKIEELLKTCSRCGTCKLTENIFLPACPAGDYFHFEAYYPSGKIGIARGLLEGKIELTDSTADVIFSCTTCGNCTVQCPMPHGEKLLEIYEVLRAECVTKIGFRKPHQEIYQSIKDYGNPYKRPKRNKGKWLKNNNVEYDESETLYFAGCTSALHAELSSIPSLSLKYLSEIFGKISALGEEEPCCGSILLRIGGLKEFAEIAEKNKNFFQKRGVKKIITSCAGCYKTFRFDYPRFTDFKIEVLHISQVLADTIPKRGYGAEERITVTYHDPCHLGRQGKVFDEPRAIISSLKNVELYEMKRRREFSFCCGAGGGVKSYKPEWAVKNAVKRIKEAEETGAKLLITSCPFCLQNLRDGIKLSNSPLQVLDLLEFLESTSHYS